MEDGSLVSGIRDNHKRGKVGEFLREKLHSGSKLSFVSAYFTINAYDALRDRLETLSATASPQNIPTFVTAARTRFGDIPKTLATASPELFDVILEEGKV